MKKPNLTLKHNHIMRETDQSRFEISTVISSNSHGERKNTERLGFICSSCKQWFVSQRGFNVHVGRMHPQMEYEQC